MLSVDFLLHTFIHIETLYGKSHLMNSPVSSSGPGVLFHFSFLLIAISSSIVDRRSLNVMPGIFIFALGSLSGSDACLFLCTPAKDPAASFAYYFSGIINLQKTKRKWISISLLLPIYNISHPCPLIVLVVASCSF